MIFVLLKDLATGEPTLSMWSVKSFLTQISEGSTSPFKVVAPKPDKSVRDRGDVYLCHDDLNVMESVLGKVPNPSHNRLLGEPERANDDPDAE